MFPPPLASNAVTRPYSTPEHDAQLAFMPPLGASFGMGNGSADPLSDPGSESTGSEYMFPSSDVTQTLAAENQRLRAMLRMQGQRSSHGISSSPPSIHGSLLPARRSHALASGPAQPDIINPLASGASSHWTTASAPATDRTALFPECGPDGKVLVLPRREIDYPHAAKYWTKRKFESSQKDEVTMPGATKGRQGPGRLKRNNENVGMQFVIDVRGNTIDGDRAEAIRDCMRTWLRGRTDLPATWKHGVSEEMRKALYGYMYERFEELQLCDFDWKVEKIAIEVFPQVTAAIRKRTQAVKASKKKTKKGKKRARESDGEAFEKDNAVDLEFAPYQMPPEFDEHGPGSPSSHPTSASHFVSESHPASEPAAKRLCPESARDNTAPGDCHDAPPPAGNDTPSSAHNDTSPSGLDSAPSPALDDIPSPISVGQVSRSSLSSGLEVLATVCMHVLASCADAEQGSETPPTAPKASGLPNQSDLQDDTAHANVDCVEGGSTLNIPDPLANMWAVVDATSDRAPSPSPPPTAPAVPALAPAKPPKKLVGASAAEPSKDRPKDKCLRIWSARNPGGTNDEFNVFYKDKIPTQYLRNKYIRCDGDMGAVPSRNRKRGSTVKGST
ncbi:hypothetical protein LXA43DRAFT_1097696 [Ganoderma leucocontextum]|nr:hypothetical protein LXA43DRAFT_1097696 [Ganoderma leucocontextum]